MLTEKEKKELLRLAQSPALRDDMRHVAAHRVNPVIFNGRVDMDRVIAFLTRYNEFINHKPKSFQPLFEKIMKL